MIRRTIVTITAVAFGVIAANAWAQHSVSDALVPQAQGFRNGVQDALGPLYRENPYAQRADKRPSKHDTTPLGMTRHWNEVAIDASGLATTRRLRMEKRVSSESSSDLPGQAGRWRSCTLLCSMLSMRSRAVIEAIPGFLPLGAIRRWKPRLRNQRMTP
jgi:hypothetical protein